MSAEVVQFPRADHREWVSKPVLAALEKKSTRWVEIKMRDGMPSVLNERGEREFNLREVRAWLVAHPARKPVDRVGELERRVGELERMISEMRRTG